MIFIKDLMTENPICISPYLSISDATYLMADKRIRHLLVVENSILLGILSINDIPRNTKSHQQVKDFMALNPVTIQFDEPLQNAISIFDTLKIGSLPVLDDQRLVGIITRYDVTEKIKSTTIINL